MKIIFKCLLQNFKIDEKDGGYVVSLSVPEIEKMEMGRLISAGKQVFQCVLLNDSFEPGEYIDQE